MRRMLDPLIGAATKHVRRRFERLKWQLLSSNPLDDYLLRSSFR